MLELVTPSAEDGAREVRRGDSLYRLTDEGAASVTVTSPRGREEGLGVDFWHYQAPTGGLYWQERWPDEPRAYEGAPIPPRALEIWPAERTTPT